MSADLVRKAAGLEILVIAALLVGAGAAPTAASPAGRSFEQAGEALLVEEAAEAGRARFQKNAFAPCGGTICARKVYTVPKKSRLELTNVACSFDLRSPGVVQGAVLAYITDLGAAGLDPVVPVKLGEFEGFQSFAFNTPTLFVGKANTKLAVDLKASDAIFNLNCKFAGELVKLK